MVTSLRPNNRRTWELRYGERFAFKTDPNGLDSDGYPLRQFSIIFNNFRHLRNFLKSKAISSKYTIKVNRRQ